MAAFDKVLSGIPEMDTALDYIRLGDNVVFRVSNLEEFHLFVDPYVEQAKKDKRNLIYFRFASHEPLVEDCPEVKTSCNACTAFLIICFMESDDNSIIILGFLYGFDHDIFLFGVDQRPALRQITILCAGMANQQRHVQLVSFLYDVSFPEAAGMWQQGIGKGMVSPVGFEIRIRCCFE